MDSEHYTITDTSISPSDFKCRVLCISMNIQYFSLINHFFFFFCGLQENYGKADPENVAKVKALYNELNLQV